MTTLPQQLHAFFERSGWHEGRRAVLPTWLPAGHPAAEVLSAFGGLTVEPAPEGVERAPSQLHFRPIASDGLANWEEVLVTTLVGIADIEGGYAELYMDAEGRCYCNSCMCDAFSYVGASFFEAALRKLVGLRSKPMLRPDQEFVHLYGLKYTQESPELYRYG